MAIKVEKYQDQECVNTVEALEKTSLHKPLNMDRMHLTLTERLNKTP